MIQSLLWQVADSEAGRTCDLAFIRPIQAGHDSKECGFTGAIWAAESHAIP